MKSLNGNPDLKPIVNFDLGFRRKGEDIRQVTLSHSKVDDRSYPYRQRRPMPQVICWQTARMKCGTTIRGR